MWIKLNGESGSGKSTIAKNVAFKLNLLPRIFVDKEDVIIKKYSRQIEFILNKNLNRSATYLGNKIQPNKYFNIEKHQNKNLYNVLKIQEYSKHLSEGESQRFKLLEAISTSPGLLIMDECLSGLPEELEYQVLYCIKQNYASINCLYISHRLNTQIDGLFEKSLRLTENKST